MITSIRRLLLKEQCVRPLWPRSLFLFIFLAFAFSAWPRGAFAAPGSLAEPGAVSAPAVPPLPGQPDVFLGLSQEKDFAAPVLRILYTASTWGETAPCPTCRTAYGGLARRAALFADRNSNPKLPTVIIAGPDEFLADSPRYLGPQNSRQPSALFRVDADSLPPLEDAKVSLAAHVLLAVDAGFLSPRSSAWLGKGAGAAPPGFSPVADAPVSRLITTPAGAVGIVFFPYGKAGAGAPTPEQTRDALEAGAALRKKAVLLLGVSPWGYEAEKNFLRQGEGVFHCLLGGGDGVSFAQAIAPDSPALLWSRPDSKGRAVTEITLLGLPPSAASGGRAEWLEGVTFKARLLFLDDTYPSAPQMTQILR